MSPAKQRELVDRQHQTLSIVQQCALLGVGRSSLYYRPKETSQQDLSLMGEMDRQYLETPFYGSRRMRASLERQGMPVSRKRVQRLMRVMGLRAIYRQPRTSQPAPERRVYPYLLRDLTITRPNQSLPPTPIGGRGGRHHLPAHGPGVPLLGRDHGLAQPVRGDLAIVQHSGDRLLCRGVERRPEPGNAQCNEHGPEPAPAKAGGSQFTSREFTQILQDHSVRISMDGRGRYKDNIFVERLWRTVKYEEVYLKAYVNAGEARRELGAYFQFYNQRRPHQALGYRTPAEVFYGETVEEDEELKERRCSDQRVSVSYGEVQESHLIVA